MSHWQKTKLKHKEGQKKKEIEEHFGIKSEKPKLVTGEHIQKPLTKEELIPKKSKSKKKSK